MRFKIIFESFLAAAIAALFSYHALYGPTTLLALALRRKMPAAWFAGLITWYAYFGVLAISIMLGAIAYRIVYKHCKNKNGH